MRRSIGAKGNFVQKRKSFTHSFRASLTYTLVLKLHALATHLISIKFSVSLETEWG